jgi:transcriptional regulator with XRE-family HTH domain
LKVGDGNRQHGDNVLDMCDILPDLRSGAGCEMISFAAISAARRWEYRLAILLMINNTADAGHGKNGSSVVARGKVSTVDLEVGQRIRLQRQMLRMSQTDLGEKLGVSFQQIQKYEKGRSRIGVGRLTQIAEILGIPIGKFFRPCDRSVSGFDFDGATDLAELLDKQNLVRLVQSFSKIKDTKVRRSLVTVIEKIVAEQR